MCMLSAPGKWSHFLETAAEHRDRISTKKSKYFLELKEEIKKRDLSEEKLKNASILGIKLPKFKGYDSDLDIYSFKSEFEKLISPTLNLPYLSYLQERGELFSSNKHFRPLGSLQISTASNNIYCCQINIY